jgi:hypothetical protein
MEGQAQVLFLEDLLGEIVLRLTSSSYKDDISPLFFISKWYA